MIAAFAIVLLLIALGLVEAAGVLFRAWRIVRRLDVPGRDDDDEGIKNGIVRP